MGIEYYAEVSLKEELVQSMIELLCRSSLYEPVQKNLSDLSLRFSEYPDPAPEHVYIEFNCNLNIPTLSSDLNTPPFKKGLGIYVLFHTGHRKDREALLDCLKQSVLSHDATVEFQEL